MTSRTRSWAWLGSSVGSLGSATFLPFRSSASPVPVGGAFLPAPGPQRKHGDLIVEQLGQERQAVVHAVGLEHALAVGRTEHAEGADLPRQEGRIIGQVRNESG